MMVQFATLEILDSQLINGTRRALCISLPCSASAIGITVETAVLNPSSSQLSTIVAVASVFSTITTCCSETGGRRNILAS